MLEHLFAVARGEGLAMLEIGGMMRSTFPALVDAVCDETEARLVLENPAEMIAACGFIESEAARVPVSRWGDPRHGGKYIFWLGAPDEFAVEDYLDERQRIMAAINERSPAGDGDHETARDDLIRAFTAFCRTNTDLTSFDLDAFAAEQGTRLQPPDPFKVLADIETRREARRRQRAVHVRGMLDDEYLLEAGRDRARALAAAGGRDAERYAVIAAELNAQLNELVDVRRRRLGVSFAVGQRPVDEAGLRTAIALLRIACDDAQRERDRVAPVLDAARRVAAYLPFDGDPPYDIAALIMRDVDRAFHETMMNVARVAFGKLIDLAWDCCEAARRTDREMASARARILLYEEYDRVKAELGTV